MSVYGRTPGVESSQAREEVVGAGDALLWTATSGAGIPFVLCHGGPGLSDNLAELASLVGDVATVHRYDQRGGGRSTGSAPYRLAQFVDDLERLRRHWGYDEWVVGGHSWGAHLAVYYAIAHRDRVTGLVYMSAMPLDRDIVELAWRRRLERLDATEAADLDRLALRAREAELDRRELARFLELLWTSDFADRDVARASLRKRPLYAHPRNLQVAYDLAAARRVQGPLAIKECAGLQMPALFIHGTADPHPADETRRLAGVLPRARFVAIDDAGHLPWLEQPRRMRDALLTFLTDLGAPQDDPADA